MKSTRRLLLATVVMSAGFTVGEPIVHEAHAGTCRPTGTCQACKNCKYCRHCSKDGGKCSVCRTK